METAIIDDKLTTTVINPGRKGKVNNSKSYILEDIGKA